MLKIFGRVPKLHTIKEAITCYESCIKIKPFEEQPYIRLMIIYRKQKVYRKELGIIQRGIKTFEDRQINKINSTNKSIASISNSILKSMGFVIKKK